MLFHKYINMLIEYYQYSNKYFSWGDMIKSLFQETFCFQILSVAFEVCSFVSQYKNMLKYRMRVLFVD